MNDDLKSGLSQDDIAELDCHNRQIDGSGCVRGKNISAREVEKVTPDFCTPKEIIRGNQF